MDADRIKMREIVWNNTNAKQFQQVETMRTTVNEGTPIPLQNLGKKELELHPQLHF